MTVHERTAEVITHVIPLEKFTEEYVYVQILPALKGH